MYADRRRRGGATRERAKNNAAPPPAGGAGRRPAGGADLPMHRKQRFLNGRIVQELRSMWQIAALRA